MGDDEKSKKNKKRKIIIEISSSSSGDEFEAINSSNSSDDDEYDDDGEDYGDNSEDNDVCNSENEEHDQDEVNDHNGKYHDAYFVDKDDEESMCNKVIQFIRGGSDLQALKLVECKAYLRKHSLRISGTKEECVERIKEHWRLKDGNGESFYPRSSFRINCTGDVCKGDVVLFNQKVYQTFDKMTRQGRLLGRRTVAGRVVKESYGVAKQQHTFTVEVLWSKGSKKLAPLFPLLVKGRNLYKMKTFRQCWKNEKERLDVLREKHKRGEAARTVRAMRKKKAEMKKNQSSTYKGAKRHKHSHDLGPSRTTKATHAKKHRVNEHGKVSGKNNTRNHQNTSSKQNGDLRGHQNLIYSNQVRAPPFFPQNCSSQTFNHFDVSRREFHHYPPHRGFASTARLPYAHPHPDSLMRPLSDFQDLSHLGLVYPPFSHSSHSFESRNLNHFPRFPDTNEPFYPSPTATHRWR